MSAFSFVLLLTVLALAYSLWNLVWLKQQAQFVGEVRAKAVTLSARLHRNIMELRTEEKDAILGGSKEEFDKLATSVAKIRDEIETNLKSVDDLALSQEAQDIVDAFHDAYRAYVQVLDRTLALAQEGKTQEALDLSRGRGFDLRLKTTDQAVAFTALQEKELEKSEVDVTESVTTMLALSSLFAGFSIILSVIVALRVGKNLSDDVGNLVSASEEIANGNLAVEFNAQSRDEIGALAQALGRMQYALLTTRNQAEGRQWLMTGVGRLNEVLLRDDSIEVLASRVISEVSEYIGGKVGALYVVDEDKDGPGLKLLGTYAYTQRKNLSNRFKPGEGLVGQAFLEKKQILIQNVPEDYIHVVSGLGQALPRNICVTPFTFEGEVRGVLEIGTLEPLGEIELRYLDQAVIAVSAANEIARNRSLVKMQQEELRASNDELREQSRVLEKAQEELESQQAALQSTNAELEVQMRRLQDSEERLKVQQEELEVTNEELHEKNELLERQKAETEVARRNIAIQAEELSMASKYKSEFLANMSHELRTPLNSLLLLARSLRENREGNLNEEQVESAGVILDSGNDLLNLINEILDLSKIEAGRMDLRLESVEVDSLMHSITSQFDHMAKNQGLSLTVGATEGVPSHITTDPTRLRQVIKNLVGNALKFTESGGVTVRFTTVAEGTNLSRSGLDPRTTLALEVQDTGIGVPLDKQKVIFEAFQQGDSGDRKRFGGTGLGLSISRELVSLLGGEIQLVSEPGKGSTFTAYFPFIKQAGELEPRKLALEQESQASAPSGATPRAPKVMIAPRPSASPARMAPAAAKGSGTTSHVAIEDDRADIGNTDRVILVVEDDARFAKILAGQVRQRGFKCIVGLTGEDGLDLAKKFKPDGVVLDLQLPNMDGWAVLNALKDDVGTRHIPVHIVSAEEPSTEGLRIGAIGHASKPLQKEEIDNVLQRLEQASATSEKRVLVVEDDPIMRKETVRLIGNGNVKVIEVATGRDALAALQTGPFALIVLDLGLPDMQGLELLKAISAQSVNMPPVIVYTVRELTMEEEMSLRHYADSIILKDVRSQDRLLDEVALFLHRVVSDLPEEKRSVIRHLHESNEILSGKKVLVVEDDMRTMFAMVKVLAAHKVNPLKAENGEKALALLHDQPDVELVLMDMMMPVMDGYETVRRIRTQDRFANLPIIALTAKAMKEDRQKCIDAGATDYLPKPVDQDRLISLMRVWLCR